MKLTLALFVLTSSLFVSGCATTEVLKKADGTNLNVRVTATQAYDKKSAPTVLIGHGSAGVTANHQEWARIIKGWGFNTVIIDHYSLRGIGIHTGQIVAGATSFDRAKDFTSVVEWVQKQSWHSGNMAIVGFSQGGAGVLAYVNSDVMKRLNPSFTEKNDPVVVSVGVYPGCLIQQPPLKPRMPVLMLLAEKDDLARPEYCTNGNSSIQFLQDSNYSVKVLSNATHSFDENIPSTVRLTFTHRYSSQAVEEMKSAMQEFLNKHLNLK